MPKKKENIDTNNIDITSIKKDLNKYIDEQLNERLEKMVSSKVKQEFIEEIDKVNKRIIREKNRKILFKNIFLILFFGIILLLSYLLYQEGYFDDFINKHKEKEIIIEEKENKIEENETNTKSLEELIKEYGYLLNNYNLNSNCKYLDDYYNGNLTDELKNYLSLNAIDWNKIEQEDEYQIIKYDLLDDVCISLFNNKCSPISFDYNGHKIKSFQKLESFITDEIINKDEYNIKREILDIKENNNSISITTIEAILIDGNIYALNNELIGEYNDSLVNYKDKLNTITYVFNNKKLIKLEKEQ